MCEYTCVNMYMYTYTYVYIYVCINLSRPSDAFHSTARHLALSVCKDKNMREYICIYIPTHKYV